MIRPFCQCGDGKCARTIPPPLSGDGTMTINGSVGLGGKNGKDDSKKIQLALNNVLEVFGGPVVPLKVDGLPWEKTIQAIRKFQMKQLGFSDGRVDPNGPTLAKLNELVDTTDFLESLAQLLGLSSLPGVAVDPKVIDDLYATLLPVIQSCVLAADATLLLARSQLDEPSSGSLFSKGAWDLVNRHFALDQNPDKRKDFEFIRAIYRDMNALLHRNTSKAEHTFVAFPGRVSAADLVLKRNAVAVAVPNGRNLTGEFTVTALDGTKITLKDNEIQIFQPFQFQPQDARVVAVIHEMSHYLGGGEGSGTLVDDHGYGWVDKLQNLSPKLKVRNAECFSNFAFDAKFHRQPLTFPA
jgi:peptidoglycan hydrolase-like protein with peptidoglycan-binding domain